MLLEEIKANLSSDEDGSSDDEPEEGKKRTGKHNEENSRDEGELQREVQDVTVDCFTSSVFEDYLPMKSHNTCI